MNYDYYYEDSKSEADEIIEEAKDKIAEIIYQKAKDEIMHVQDAYEIQKKNYKDAMNKVGELTQQNIIKDKEIEKLKAQIESGDKKSLTNLPISVGDKVWVVAYERGNEVTCPICGGSSYVEKLIDNVKYKADCPSCSYSVPKNNRVSSKASYYFYKIKECKVDSLTVHLTKDSRTIAYWATDVGWNGTASKYEEDRVFKFKDDAQNKADELHRSSRAKAYKDTGRDIPEELMPYLEEDRSND
jgi:hypothetical protein